jgi:hypothetical protein
MKLNINIFEVFEVSINDLRKHLIIFKAFDKKHTCYSKSLKTIGSRLKQQQKPVISSV